MLLDRREWLRNATAGLALNLAGLTAMPQGKASQGIKAIAFDAFPIFDARPVFALAEDLFPGKGRMLSEAWRSHQFEYALLRVMAECYADFWQVTKDALIYAAKALKLDLTAEPRERLMQAYLNLPLWPDVVSALRTLREAGFLLAILSNFTPRMLEANLCNAHLDGLFEHSLSTDVIRSYKPAPRAYRMVTEAFGLNREEILFVAFAGWDAAGARAFGYKTFWVNRLNLPAEELGETADAAGDGLRDLVAFLST
jgi:2-haloacid dehalogenase